MVDQREGPVPLEADSWDDDPNLLARPLPVAHRRPARSWPRLVAAVVGLLILGGIVAVRMVTASGSLSWHSADGDAAGGAGEAASTRGGPDGGAGSTQLPPLPSPLGSTGSDSRSTGSDSNGNQNDQRGRSGSESGSGAAASPSVPFTPLTFEAEAGPPVVTLHGAQVAAGASGSVVLFVDPSGDIELSGITMPADGTYRIAITYVGDASLPVAKAKVEVDGDEAAMASLSGSGCCAVSTVDIIVPVGPHTITVSGSKNWTPAIDKVTISRV